MDLGKIMEVFRERFKEVEKELSKPEVASDPEKLMEYGKKHSELSEIINLYGEISSMKSELEDWHEMKTSADESELEEIDKTVTDLESSISRQELNLKGLLVPDLSDERNIIIEIRAGTGGEEAALFAADLFRMYNRYAERNNWKSEIIDSNETDIGGLKEMIFQIRGRSVFSKLKYESGVHRVQRVPSTESGGRIHTSTATVAVLPEASETEVKIDPADLRIDTYRASGAGGQHVNKTDSAVRITHLSTGIVVACQTERSQHQNKANAMKMLYAKLYEIELEKKRDEKMKLMGDQKDISWGNQIRSYVFQPYTMVKDHRTEMETGNIQAVMDGEIDEFLEKELVFFSAIEKSLE